MLNAQLAKMKIYSYENRERKTVKKMEGVEANFEAMFNPSTLSFSHMNKYSETQGINTSASEASYQHTSPRNLVLELIIDMTGLCRDKLKVKEKVKNFFELFVMDGNTHQPPFLKIYWGEMQWGWGSQDTAFDCRISSVDVTYTLFAKNGEPLRAILKTSFIEDISEEKRVNSEKKNSPDLSHIRIVNSGNNLPLLCKEIYQDPSLYIKIARYNKLDNFRSIKPGTSLEFPPINDNVKHIL